MRPVKDSEDPIRTQHTCAGQTPRKDPEDQVRLPVDLGKTKHTQRPGQDPIDLGRFQETYVEPSKTRKDPAVLQRF